MSELYNGRIKGSDKIMNNYAFDAMRMNYYKFVEAGIAKDQAKTLAGFHENGDIIPYSRAEQVGQFARSPLDYFGAFDGNKLKGLVRIGEWTSNDAIAFENPLVQAKLRFKSLFRNYLTSETMMDAMEKPRPLEGNPLGLTALVAAQDVDQLAVMDDLLLHSLNHLDKQDPSKRIFAVHYMGDKAREVTEAYGFISTGKTGSYDGLYQELFVREGPQESD